MPFFTLSFISSFSIIIAVISGLVRYRFIRGMYQPFFILCSVAFCNELVSFFLIRYCHKSNALNANIYVLIEACLFAWQFRRWGLLQKAKWQLPLLMTSFVLVWVYDNFILNQLSNFNSLFRIYYSFCLIFLSNAMINILLLQLQRLLVNPVFLICAGILIFYSYKATIEVFYLLKLAFSNEFYDNVFFILSIVNIFVNLLFALALLWIPKKRKFILPF